MLALLFWRFLDPWLQASPLHQMAGRQALHGGYHIYHPFGSLYDYILLEDSRFGGGIDALNRSTQHTQGRKDDTIRT